MGAAAGGWVRQVVQAQVARVYLAERELAPLERGLGSSFLPQPKVSNIKMTKQFKTVFMLTGFA